MNQLFTVEEIATYLKVCPKTVRDHLKAGRMKGLKIGKFWRINDYALRDFLNYSKEKMKDEKHGTTTDGDSNTS